VRDWGLFIFSGPEPDTQHTHLAQSAAVEVKGAKKRVLSAAARAAISKVAKKRRAKVRKQAKEVTG
jgi:hypothetical protein